MSIVKGFVKKIAVKEGRSGRGPWKLYSLRLELDNGVEFDKWLSAGFDKPAVNEGDYVKVTYEENDKGYLNVKELKTLKNPPARTASGGNAAPSGVQTTQKSIHYQSSRKDAIEVIGLLLSNDALPLTGAKGKAGEAKRYEELMALVDKLTVRFFNDTETQRILETVADEGKVTKDVGELPDADEDDEDEIDEDEIEDEEDDE